MTTRAQCLLRSIMKHQIQSLNSSYFQPGKLILVKGGLSSVKQSINRSPAIYLLRQAKIKLKVQPTGSLLIHIVALADFDPTDFPAYSFG
jgi:hypothetical protein